MDGGGVVAKEGSMRGLALLILVAMVVLAASGMRTEAQEKDDLEARVAQLETRIAELETGAIFPGEDVRYENIGVTETKGLFLGKNRVSIACLVTPLEDALAPELQSTWKMPNWSFLSCVRFPPTMGMQ
jgi:hypothetical protein